jgi:hypothetical protein
VKLAIEKVPLVEASFEFKPTLSCLFAFEKVSRVFDLIIVPAFNTITVLHVVFPVTGVHATVRVDKDSESMSLAIDPLSLIDVSVHMSHAPFSVIVTVHCLSLIKAPISKFDNTKAFPDVEVVCSPLSFVFALSLTNLSIFFR